MERGSNCINGTSKARRILDWFTKKLGRSDQGNGNGQRNNKKAVWQEEAKSTRIKGRREYMVGDKKYPFKQTLEEVGLEKI